MSAVLRSRDASSVVTKVMTHYLQRYQRKLIIRFVATELHKGVYTCSIDALLYC